MPLALHDEIGGQLYVRSSWDDDAAWIGFFKGQLQLFQDGSVTRIDPLLSREPLDIDAAIVFFARNSKRFQTPARLKDRPARAPICPAFSLWASIRAAPITWRSTARK